MESEDGMFYKSRAGGRRGFVRLYQRAVMVFPRRPMPLPSLGYRSKGNNGVGEPGETQ
jgi:hypothetical protein